MTKKHILPVTAFLVFQTSFSVNLLPAFAADDASNSALVDMIRHANIVNSNFKLTVTVASTEALITTQCKAKSTEADQKIEAVLIAKTAFESLPDTVQRVKLLLLDYDANSCNTITVKRAEVKLFGTGGLSQKELLDSLEISKSNDAVASSGASVVDGPEQGARMLVFGRIEKLKTQGANVSGYISYFKQIEDAAKAGDDESVKTKCSYLCEKLADQESLIKQLRKRATANASKAIAGSPTATAATLANPLKTTLGAPSVDAVQRALASSLPAQQLASIDSEAVAVGYRNSLMSERLQALQSRGVDTKGPLAMSMQVQRYLVNGDTGKAAFLLSQLEQLYPNR